MVFTTKFTVSKLNFNDEAKKELLLLKKLFLVKLVQENRKKY
jgi:hypothetical protein